MIQPIVPGGLFTSVSSGALAGNATYQLTPGTGIIYQVISSRITLTTDATVATRNIYATRATSGGIIYDGTMVGADRAASGTTTMFLSGIASAFPGASKGTFAIDGGVFYIQEYFITPSIRYQVTINNGVAGDSFTVLTFYRVIVT